MERMSNRLPVGPGSRGGHWHEPLFRAAYFRRWRASHLEYRLRERQRMLLNHAMTRLARVVAGGSYERPR
jgi:hypothetical protein